MRVRCALAVVVAVIGCGGEYADEAPPLEGRQAPVYNPQRFDAMEPGIFKAYLRAQDALAHDRYESAVAALADLAKHSDGELLSVAVAASRAEDLAGVRVAFRSLSEQVIALPRPQGLDVVYCPMAFSYAGARWVQTSGTVMNPYYGASMQHCGARPGSRSRC
jgi:Cu(I)/Ag(I) efflux system membrane fusion protein